MKFCSLGKLCQSSKILQRIGVKNESYPFDWVHSNLDIIQHCIDDDFKSLMDKSFYFSSTDKATTKSCNHEIYSKMCGGVFFRHRDPLSIEDDYNYFVRCVDRFRMLLKSEERKTFIQFYRGHEEESITKTINFNQNFKKITSNYKIITILHELSNETNHTISNISDDLKIIFLKTKSPSCGMTFAHEDDNVYLDNVIKSSII
jgi:hypothetical protein